MILRHVLSAAALGAMAAGPASARDEGMRQLGAHVHGAAELIAAADPGGLVVAEFNSAAWNLYGFESAPQSDDQAATVRAVRARLAGPGLVAFSDAAGCALNETAVLGGPLASEDGHAHDHHDDHGHGDHEHGDHGHGDHEHGDDPDHHGHDDHAHASEGDHGHSDVVVNWTFQCESPARLGALDLSGLFAAFARLERVEVQYLDDDTAAARQLTPESPVLNLD